MTSFVLFVFQYQQLVQHVTLIVDLSIVRNMGACPLTALIKHTWTRGTFRWCVGWLRAAETHFQVHLYYSYSFIHFKTTSWIRGHDDALAYPSSQKWKVHISAPLNTVKSTWAVRLFALCLTSIAKLLITCCLFLIFVKCLHVLLV